MIVGGVWLFAVIACLDAIEPACRPQVIQRVYPNLSACERAKAAVLRQSPGAYAVCER